MKVVGTGFSSNLSNSLDKSLYLNETLVFPWQDRGFQNAPLHKNETSMRSSSNHVTLNVIGPSIRSQWNHFIYLQNNFWNNN